MKMNMHACHNEIYIISYLQPTADGEILCLFWRGIVREIDY
jgi:hypothetical protein